MPPDYSTPFQISVRHAQTQEIEHILIDPLISADALRRKIRMRLGNRPREMYDWAGLKQGDRVICRAKRLENGSWEIERVKEVKDGETSGAA